ncbi:MAG: hypothetical protein SGJ18_02985 [Pseudomonadota bacterium]|nr:hypothetical protein [Pseudomonadota bacterium]
MWRFLIGTSFLVLSKVSLAEYRAFELRISNTQTGKNRIVRSILDQGQYPQYYYLSAAEIIEYQDSWMCYERSDHFKPICANPNESQERAPTPP